MKFMPAIDPRAKNKLLYGRPERDDSIPIGDYVRAALKGALALGIGILVMALLVSLGPSGGSAYR
jgi:hypothetical protein